MPKNLTHPGADGPSGVFAPVVPDDGADLPGGVARAIYVGGAGALTLRGTDGTEATIVSGGAQYHPLRIRRVLATGTTATGIVALY